MSAIQIDTEGLSKSSNENDVTANGFKLGDDVYNITQYATKPAAAIARLAAGDMMDDKFGGYERISMEDFNDRYYRGNMGVGQPVISNINFHDWKVTLGDGTVKDFHPLIYVKTIDDGGNVEVIIEACGVLLHLDCTLHTDGDLQGRISGANIDEYNPRTDIDAYTDFCSRQGIDESTKLGMTILLKQLLVSEGYDIAELDKVLADPQPEALAFYQQIIGPALEAMITLAMTSFKKFAEFIKQIINGSMKG